MRYNEKRSLYESIMKDVAKVVKRHLNENNTSRRWRRHINESESDIASLTYDDFNDPDNNELFQSMAPNQLSVSGNKISLTFDIIDSVPEDVLFGTFTITRNTMAEVIKTYFVLGVALINSDPDIGIMECIIDKNFNRLRKAYLNMLDNDEHDTLDKYESKLSKMFESSSNLKSMINKFCREGISML
jgi:hypothetical protein